MDLRQVGHVLAVVDEGGFTRAAEARHITQPALSEAVRRLEQELGVALFHRVGRGVRLTAAGEAFVDPARQLVRDVGILRASVAAVAGLRSGQLDIASLPTLAVEPLVPLLGRFRHAAPEVTVRLVETEDVAGVAAAVRSGRSELGFTELPSGDDRLVAHPLAEQEILAVCPPATEVPARGLPVERLASMPLITTPPGTSTRMLVDRALRERNVQPPVAVETAHREAIVPLVLAGAGTCFLPRPQARRAEREGAVVTSLRPRLTREVGIIHREGPLSPAASAFVEIALVTNA
jgi:DNA-binding transcriptional LysR family regulator